MAISFEDIRKGTNSKRIVIKSYDLNGSKIVITNEETVYVARIDGISISDGYDNPYDAETAAEKAIELLQKKAEGILEAKANFTYKEFNKLSDNMKLNSIQKGILFDYVNKGILKTRYVGKEAGYSFPSKKGLSSTGSKKG